MEIPIEINPPLQYEFVVDQKHVINYAQEYQFKIFPFPKNHILPIENYIRASANQSLKPKNCLSLVLILNLPDHFRNIIGAFFYLHFLLSALLVTALSYLLKLSLVECLYW